MKLSITRFILVGFITISFFKSSFGQGSTNVPVALSANSGRMNVAGSSPDSRGWTDPALNHNKLLQQTTDGNYKLIGPYKVVGTQFLFGEHHSGDMFAPEAKAYNIYISYNTYNQELEFYSTSNPDKPLVREVGTVDSFIIHANPEIGIAGKLKFVYASVLSIKEKYYYQEIYAGKNYSIYKRYKSALGYVETNIAQPDLRRFDLNYDYYYVSSTSKGIEKIKANAYTVIKEFKSVKDLSGVITNEMFDQNPENALRIVFEELNR